MVTEVHTALRLTGVPQHLRRPSVVKNPSAFRRCFLKAAALLLIVTLPGASSNTLASIDGHRDEFASVPPVVLGLASPSTSTCDASRDVPIFTGVKESPIAEMSVLLTPDGVLKTTCHGDETVLDEDVSQVKATRTPHVFQASTREATVYYNLNTGESLSIPLDDVMKEVAIIPSGWESWIVMASSDDGSLASLYDLETFTEIPITGPEGERGGLTDMFEHAMAVNESTAVIAIGSASFDPNSDVQSGPLQGFFVAAKNADTRFINAQADEAPSTIALSPDGEIIAASSYEGTDRTGTTTVSLYTTTDGSLIGSWEHETANVPTEASFLQNGSALLFTDGTALYKIDLAAEQLVPEVLVEGSNVNGLTLTPDEDVVAIGYVTEPDSGLPKPTTAIINVASVEMQELDGRDIFTTGWGQATVRSTLVLSQMGVQPGGSAPTIVINAVTGEELGEIDTIVSSEGGFNFSAWGFGRGDIVVFAFGPDSMWRVVDQAGKPTFERIEPPSSLQDPATPAMHLTVSPDGFLHLRTFDPDRIWFQPPSSAPGEWIEIETHNSPEAMPVSIEFILGD